MAVYACKGLHARPGGIAWKSFLKLHNSCKKRSKCLAVQLCTNAQYQGAKSRNSIDLSEDSPCDKSKMP